MWSYKDLDNFAQYCHCYADTHKGHSEFADVETVLKYWHENKSKYLFDLMGNELILSKEVTIERPFTDMRERIEDLSHSHRHFIHELFNRLRAELGPNYTSWGTSECRFYDSIQTLLNGSNLAHDEGVNRDVTVTLNGHKVVLSMGQKPMRALRKVAMALDLKSEFEAFCLDHSRVMNDRRMTGILNLSIHPLDYATASDNCNNWSSCMSWENEGSYRLGTVEMMNSPMVICAYLSGKNQMDINGVYEWNSKKWRAWAIVYPEIVLMNRNYPFDHDGLCEETLMWIRELAQKNLGWEFGKPHKHDSDHCYEFYTEYMYNDVQPNTNYVMLAPRAVKHAPGERREVFFSGPASCIVCGKRIDYTSSDNANTLCCDDCRDGDVCHHCGCILHEDEMYEGADGELYCEGCYSELFGTCNCCQDIIPNDDLIEVQVPLNPVLANAEIEKMCGVYDDPYWSIFMSQCNTAWVCEHCLRSYAERYEDDEGRPYIVDTDKELALFYHRPQSGLRSFYPTHLLNPNCYNFEQACYLMDWSYTQWGQDNPNYTGRLGSDRTKLYHKLWEAYKERFNEIMNGN